ncbi:MAG: type II toxin-antitoxin system VapC family toxin [Thermoanaerobaculia bacterium]
MKVVYAETSAVLAWLLGDESRLRARRVVDSADQVVTSVLTLVEATRGILRAANEQRVAAVDASRLRGLLARTTTAWELMEITPEIRVRAGEPFPVEPVRTLDAIHLATALQFARALPELSVLTFDERILANLEPLGLLRAARR